MRESTNEHTPNGSLLNGFDYDLQVWIRDGRVLNCGHPATMACGCNARTLEGLTLSDARTFRLLHASRVLPAPRRSRP